MEKTTGWKDATSYSQGERAKNLPPRTYELKAGQTSLIVTRHVHHDKTDWVLRMEGFFETVLRGDKTAEFAMANCMMLARDYLRQTMNIVTKELNAAEAEAEMEASLPAAPETK
jgi:hypothetical protein